jgi:hypothetical protein
MSTVPPSPAYTMTFVSLPARRRAALIPEAQDAAAAKAML